MYQAIHVAKYIISHEHKRDRVVSNLRLQKLLYFVQLKVLSETGAVCFDDIMQAWPLRPVVPAVYHKYKIFGAFDIWNSEIANETDNHFDNKNIRKHIDSMLESCATRTDSRLVEISHSQSPWKTAIACGSGTEITVESLKEFLESLRK